MRAQGRWVYDQYLRTFSEMALTTLQIINDRVMPHAARSYEQWNDPPHLVRTRGTATLSFREWGCEPGHERWGTLVRPYGYTRATSIFFLEPVSLPPPILPPIAL